jgi:hypothetical protein
MFEAGGDFESQLESAYILLRHMAGTGSFSRSSHRSNDIDTRPVSSDLKSNSDQDRAPPKIISGYSQTEIILDMDVDRC